MNLIWNKDDWNNQLGVKKLQVECQCKGEDPIRRIQKRLGCSLDDAHDTYQAHSE